ARAGKRLWSRSTACCESVCESAKLFALRLPTAWESATRPAARTIQVTTTSRRGAIVQRVNFNISELPSPQELFIPPKLAQGAETLAGCLRAMQIFAECRVYAYTERG